MINEEIQEGNKLIAEFMGGRFYPNGGWSEWSFPDGGKPSILYYHSSWDWLMPVLNKIEKQGCIVEIWGSLGWSCRICIINGGKETISIIDGDQESPINAVYPVVLKYLTWYNQQEK